MNKKIKNATMCKSGSISFKSKLEKTIYDTLLEHKIKVSYEPFTYTLWPSFMPITPFYDKETNSQQKKRIDNGDNIKSKILKIKNATVLGTKYTPDFFFKYNDIDVYIEAKGIENEVFYIKKKLFRKYLDDKYIRDKQKSIYFEIYSKKHLLQVLNILKEYDKS